MLLRVVCYLHTVLTQCARLLPSASNGQQRAMLLSSWQCSHRLRSLPLRQRLFSITMLPSCGQRLYTKWVLRWQQWIICEFSSRLVQHQIHGSLLDRPLPRFRMSLGIPVSNPTIHSTATASFTIHTPTNPPLTSTRSTAVDVPTPHSPLRHALSSAKHPSARPSAPSSTAPTQALTRKHGAAPQEAATVVVMPGLPWISGTPSSRIVRRQSLWR